MMRLSPREAACAVGMKLFVYGPAGAGKTTLIKTAPGPKIVLDFEGGVLSLMDAEDVTIVPVTSTDELAQVVRELVDDTTFKTIAFDGLSLFIRNRMQTLLNETGKQRPTFSEWNVVTNEVRSAIMPLLHIKGRVLLVTSLSKVEIETIRENGQVRTIVRRIRPDLPPGIMQDVIAASDFVAYLASPTDRYVRCDERTLVFKGDFPFELVTKARLPVENMPANIDLLLRSISLDISAQTIKLPSPIVPKPQAVPEQVSQQQEANNEARKQQQSGSSERNALIREIFNIAKDELGMDNKALGRLARDMFGTGFVRELGDEQLHQLLNALKTEAHKRKEQAQREEQAQQTEQARQAPQLLDESVESILDELFPSWRDAAIDESHADLLEQLNEIFRSPDWTKELAEVMVFQAASDVGLPNDIETAEALKDPRVVRKLVEELSESV